MIFELASINETSEHWLFFTDDKNGRSVIRAEYSDLKCSFCGKIDEERAMLRGICKDFIITSQKDWIGTSDNQICVSKVFREIIENQGLEGLKFLDIPSNPNYFVAVCICLVKTDEKLASFDCRDKCSICGRYREKFIGPLQSGMEVPKEKINFFASEIANENIKVSYRPIFADKNIVAILKNNNIKGIDFVEAL